MKSLLKITLISSFILCACANTPDKCDPSNADAGFFDKLGCVTSGSYEKRVQAKSAEIKDLAAQQKALSEEVIALEQNRSTLVSDRAARLREMDKVNANLAALEQSLKEKNAMSASLKEKINNVKKASTEVSTLDDDASLMEKRARLNELQQQYNELLDGMSRGDL